MSESWVGSWELEKLVRPLSKPERRRRLEESGKFKKISPNCYHKGQTHFSLAAAIRCLVYEEMQNEDE